MRTWSDVSSPRTSAQSPRRRRVCRRRPRRRRRPPRLSKLAEIAGTRCLMSMVLEQGSPQRTVDAPIPSRRGAAPDTGVSSRAAARAYVCVRTASVYDILSVAASSFVFVRCVAYETNMYSCHRCFFSVGGRSEAVYRIPDKVTTVNAIRRTTTGQLTLRDTSGRNERPTPARSRQEQSKLKERTAGRVNIRST